MEVCAQTAILNRAPERNRSMYLALYFCFSTLLGNGLANTAGGWLLDNSLRSLENMGFSLLGVTFSRYNYLFLLTFILRVFCAFILLPRMISPDKNAEIPEPA